MRNYVIRRLIQIPVVLFVMSVGFFLLIHVLPGGPEAVLFNPRLPGTTRTALRHYYGLDRSLPVQYIAWFTSVLHGDFGNSFVSGQPVLGEVTSRIPATLELLLTAFTFALIVAVVLGVTAAIRQYSVIDYVVTVLAYFGISMPVFWFALGLQVIFGVRFQILPTFGSTSADTSGFTALGTIEDHLLHLILPAITIALPSIAVWSRYLRSSMLDVIKQDYIRTARAKGLSSQSIFFRHALHNALNPLLTQVAIDFGSIFSGAVITEAIFAWPGLGRLFYDALMARDYPIMLALLLLGATSFIIFNLLADVLYAVIDPRVRYS